MRGLFILVMVYFNAHFLLADLAITTMTYDEVADDLIINARFPGKCLPHDFTLKKTRQRNNKYYFRLEVSNAHDPCNAINEKSERFSLAEVVKRPAEILVSVESDGSKPRFVAVSPHPAAKITKVIPKPNRTIVFTILAKGPVDASRFYVDIDGTCSATFPPSCTGVLRDKRGRQFAKKKERVHSITVTPDDNLRGQNLSFVTHDGAKGIRVYLP